MSQSLASRAPMPPARPRRGWLLAALCAIGLIAALALLLRPGSSGAAPTCTIYWTGTTSSAWSTTSNWSLTNGGAAASRVPTSTDFVCFSTAPARQGVTLTDATTVAGINWAPAGSVTPTLAIGSTLTIGTTGPSNLGNTSVNSGGVLVPRAATTVQALTVTSSGEVDGPGTVTVPSGGSLKFDASNGNYASLGAGARVVNKGSASVLGYAPGGYTSVYFSGGSTFTNQGTLSLADNAYLSSSGDAGNVVLGSEGSTLSFGAGTAFGVPTSLSGSVTVSGVGLFSQPMTLTNGASLVGGGTVAISSTLTVPSGASATVSKLEVRGGSEVDGPGTLTVPSGGSLKFDASNGNYASLGAGARLVNKGSASVLGYAPGGYVSVYFSGGSTITNQGTLSLGDNAALYSDGADGNFVLNDAGATMSFAGGAADAQASFVVPFVNKGAVSVTKGVLSLGRQPDASADTGSLAISAGAQVLLTGRRVTDTGATVTGAGPLVVDPSGVLAPKVALSVPQLITRNSGTIEGPGTVTVPSGGSLKFDASNGNYASLGAGARLVNKGSASVLGYAPGGYPSVYFSGGSTFTSQGTLSLADNAYLYSNGEDGNQLVNDVGATVSFAGTAAEAQAQVTVPLVNKGAVSVTKGVLVLGASGASADTGSLAISSGAQLQLTGRRVTDAGATVAGAGQLVVDSGGVLAPKVALSVPQLITRNGGTIEGPGTVTVPSGGSLKFDASNGNYASLGAGARLVNKGSASVLGYAPGGYPSVYFSGGSTFTNQGTLSLADNAYLYSNGEDGNQLVNDVGATVSFAGTAAEAQAQVTVPLVNKGAVSVTKGVLVLGASGASADTGSLAISSGAQLQLTGRRVTDAGATVAGAGQLVVDSGGVLAPKVALSVPQLITRNGGTIEGPGTLTVPSGGSLKFDASNGNYASLGAGARVVNKGSASVLGYAPGGYTSVYFSGGSTFTNQGTLSLADNAYLSSSGDAGNVVLGSEGSTLSFGAGTAFGVPTSLSGSVTVSGVGLFSQPMTLTNGASLVGGGTVAISSTLTVPSGASATVSKLEVRGGEVDGPGTLTVPSGGSLKFDASNGNYASLGAGARLVNKGSASLLGYAPGGYTSVYFSGGSTFTNQGTLSLADNAYLSSSGDASNQLVNDAGATTKFAGSVPTATAQISVPLQNRGTISATKGSLDLAGLTSLSSGELLSGTYDANGGTLVLPGAVTKNSGTVNLGVGGAINYNNSGTATNALTTLTQNAGTLNLARPLTVSGALANSGNVNVGATTLTATSYSQSAGTTNLMVSSAVLKAGSGTSAITITGGTLTGNGTAQGAVSGAGTFKPGSAAGPLMVTGTFAPAAAAKTAITVTGPSAVGTDFGQVSATGNATLNGTLAITTAAGYLPPLGTQYTVVKAAAISGNFSAMTGDVLSDRQYVQSSTSTTRVLTVKQAPSFTSAASGSAPVGTATSLTISAKGYETPAITLAGTLPSGLSFVDNGSGTATISGTPAVGTGGSYPLTLKATNGVGSPATQTYTLTITEAPAFTTGTQATFTTGQAGTYTFATRGYPAPTLTETGALPAGVTFTANSGGTATLAGTPSATAGGSYPITVKADNGTSATQSFTLTVKQAPQITSAATTTLTTNTAGSFTIKASGYPAATLTSSGTLPSGVTFTSNANGTATLGGTPAATSAGTYPLTITAANGVGTNVTQSFSLVVKNPLAITSSASATFVVGQAGSFKVTTTASGSTTLTRSGTLPVGVTFTDNGDGTATLAGTPAAGSAATYPLTLTVSNAGGSVTQSFTLDVRQAPAITSGSSPRFYTALSNTHTITTTGRPASTLTQTGTLPAGVTFTNKGDGTAVLSGTPTQTGTFPLTIKAANGVGSDATQTLTLTVVASAAPAFTSPANAAWAVGTATTFKVTTSGAPSATLTAGGTLPSGLTFTDTGGGTATVSGTPATGTAGAYPVTITAKNAIATTTQTFTINVGAATAPAFTSAASATFPAGQAQSFAITTSGYPSATITQASGTLPSGLTLTVASNGRAVLAGTPAAGTRGAFTIGLSATNGVGTAASQTLTINVTSAPAFTSSATTTFATAVAKTFAITTTAYPTAVLSLSGTLPSGVTFASNGDGSAKLTGTAAATAVGTYPLTLTATNSAGTSTQSYSLVVRKSKAPAITSAATQAFATGQPDSFDVTTSGYPQASITVSGTLPGGVTFTDNHDGTGTFGGTPAAGAGGSYPLTIKAANGTTDATQSFVLTTGAATAPSFTGSAFASFVIGAPGSFTVTTTGIPTATIAKSGTLPSGLTFHDNNDGTATISGTPAADSDGSYSIVLTARNHASARKTYTIDVN